MIKHIKFFFIALIFFSIPFIGHAENNYVANFSAASNQYFSTSLQWWPSASGFSIVGWIYPTADSEEALISKWNGGGNLSWDLRYDWGGGNNDALAFFFSTTGSNESTIQGPNIAKNTWTHIALIYDGVNLKWYVNGSLSETDTVSITTYQNTGNITIGKMGAYDNYFTGMTDDFMIFNEVISTPSLLSFFECKIATSTDIEETAIAIWQFENNGYDLNRNYDLTNNNSVLFASTSLPYIDDCQFDEIVATTTPAVMYMTYPDDISITHKFTTEYNASGTITGYLVSDEYNPFKQVIWWVIVQGFIAFILIYFHLLYEKKKKRF